jgi:hypothetical protein
MELMGLPLDGLEQFLAWEHDILHLSSAEDPDRSRAFAPVVAVQGYFADLIADKRKAPGDDLLTALRHGDGRRRAEPDQTTPPEILASMIAASSIPRAPSTSSVSAAKPGAGRRVGGVRSNWTGFATSGSRRSSP